MRTKVCANGEKPRSASVSKQSDPNLSCLSTDIIETLISKISDVHDQGLSELCCLYMH